MNELVFVLACAVIGGLAGILAYQLLMPWSEQFMEWLFGRWLP